MTKKNILQNLRNKRINKRYIFSLKTLYKVFLCKIEESKKLTEPKINLNEINLLISNLFSIIDKSIKKGVIHYNKGNRRKNQINKLYKTLF